MRTTVGIRVVAPVAVAALLAACTGRGIDSLPAPPTTGPPRSTTTLPDYSKVDLRAVAGRTTTTVAMGPGQASLSGSVAGPDGAVGSAIVLIERLVGDGTATAELATAADGSWSLREVRGGRFRVRAWHDQLDLSMTKPAVVFLAATETRSLELKVDRFAGVSVTAAVAPNPPVVEDVTNLVIQVTDRSVDDRGVVVGVPLPSTRVELFGAGEWQVRTANPSFTDANGRARWELRCRSSGRQPMGVIVGDTGQFPLELPPCAEATPSTTESPTTSQPTTTPTRPPA